MAGAAPISAAVHTAPFGRGATLALAGAIAAAQRHPLDPVTVVVPSNLAGLSARRTMAAGLVGGAGLANVSFVTAFRLAELLGAGRLGSRRPLTNPVLAAAVRAALRADAGAFAPVATHHATHRALVDVYGELSRAGTATLDRIAAASVRGREVVRLFRAVRAGLGCFYDEDDLAAAAEARVVADPAFAAATLGSVAWYLPGRLTPALARLLGAVLGVVPSTVIAALTGDDDADTAVRHACAAAGVHLPLPPPAGTPGPRPDLPGPPTAGAVVSVSDADEEVRAVVRRVLALAEAGTPLHRVGVFHAARDPYARTLNEQFDAAGIPHNGPSRTPLADTAAGRTLLRALALPADGWGRGALIALVSGAPVRHGPSAAPATRWDAVSRAAGVVAGLDDWRTKLPELASRLRAERAQLDATGQTSPGRLEALDGDAGAAEELCAFVDDLAAAVAAVEGANGWTGRTDAARALLGRLLPPEQRRHRWPATEVEAAERVDAALSRLAVLDEIEPGPSPDAFAAAVAAELDEPAGRVGRFGEGVVHGPLASAVGLDLDAVFLLGMAEGGCPRVARAPALLPEDDRHLAEPGELARAEDLLADQHRDFLAALAAAPGPARRVLLYPRGDLRGGRTSLPSRWLLTSASALAGRPVRSSEFADLGPPLVEVVPSFAAGVAHASVLASVAERDLAALCRHVQAGGDPAAHPVAGGELAAGLTCRRARSSPAFTEWDGNLAGCGVESPATGAAMSASRLQTWASCPFAYLLAHVLHLSDRDDPERITEIGAADKGSLVHEVLERFVAEAVARPGGPPPPAEPWSDGDRARLHSIAAEVFGEYEAKGLTGRPLTWRLTQHEVLADLDELLDRDGAHRAGHGVVPVEVEMPFGMDGAEPLVVRLPSGRELRFRGKIDRVDEGPGRHVVLDYKTGKGDKYRKLEGDPVLAGTALQLGLYAEAARARLGAGDVDAYYWLATSAGDFAKRGYSWTEDRRARFLEVLEAIVDGIEAGAFPAVPGEYDSFFRVHDNCRFCEFDRLCPRDRDDHARAKKGAPELAVLARLELLPEPQPDQVGSSGEGGPGDPAGGGGSPS